MAIIKTSLFNEEETKEVIDIGSKEWRRKRYYELCKMSFEELEDYLDSIISSQELYDYYSCSVAIDVLHSYYFDEFYKKYPKILFGKRKIEYLN